MEEEDYIETSDPEERAELLGFLTARIATSSPRQRSGTPKKRRKLDHHDVLSSPRTPSRVSSAGPSFAGTPFRRIHHPVSQVASSTPQAVSLATSPTAATVGDLSYVSPFTQKTAGLLGDEIIIDEDFDSFSQGYRQVEPDERVLLDDILSTPVGVGSQDELDIMSQATKGSSRSRGARSNESELSGVAGPSVYFSPPKGFSQLITPAGSSSRKKAGTAGKNVAVGALDLFSQQVAHPGEAIPAQDGAVSPLSPLSSADGDRDCDVRRPSRFSSLPPSSPARASTPARTPQRARTHSPENSQRQHHPSGDNIVHTDDAIPPHLLEDEENATRRYSLRNRQPRQLNPYEYDKRMYRMQLRRIPEAIVKVVSPPRRPGEHGHGHKNREAEEDEFIAPDETEESQEQRLARRQQRRQSSHDVQKDERIAEIFKDYELPDDDLPPLPSLNSPATDKGHTETLPKKRRKKAFPLILESKQNKPSCASEEDTSVKTPHVAIGYGRRKIVRSPAASPLRMSSGRRLNSPHEESPRYGQGPQVSGNRTKQGDGTPNLYDGTEVVDDFAPWAHSPIAPSNQKRPSLSPINVSDSEVVHAGPRHGAGTPEDGNQNSDGGENEEAAGDESMGESESDEEELDRSRLKALKRMMPAFMINKILGTQAPAQPQARADHRVRSTSIASPVQSSDDEGPVVPGRSKIIRRVGGGQVPIQIKGDSESSEEESNRDEKDRAIVLSSDSEAFGVDSDRSDDHGVESDIGHPQDLFDEDASNRYQPSRKREDLIDRMLSRTRNDGSRKARRRKHYRPTHTRSGSEATTKLRKSGLDVNISASRSRIGGRQTRLPFDSILSDHDHADPGDFVDVSADEQGEHDDPGVIQLDDVEIEQPKKLTKKQRREAALQKQLFTMNTGRRAIGNGRKKGFIQIDIGDEAFRAALAPVRSEEARQPPRRIFKKSNSETKSTKASKGRSFLKQASLHDFPHHDDGVLVDVDRLSYQDDHHVLGEQPSWKDDDVAQGIAKLTVDFDITAVPPGVRFGPSTYLGKFQLHDLITFINGDNESRAPLSYSDFGNISLKSDMASGQLSEALDNTIGILSGWLRAEKPGDSEELGSRSRRHDSLMFAVIQTSVWVFIHSDDTGRSHLQTAMSDFFRRLRECIQSTVGNLGIRERLASTKILSVMWFNVNLSSRWFALSKRANLDVLDDWTSAVELLLDYLLDFNLQKVLESVQQAGDLIETDAVQGRVAELWICLIHFLPSMSTYVGGTIQQDQVFWTFAQRALKELELNGRPDLENSEFQWRLLFGLSALGHFTRNGIATTSNQLSASWDIVSSALDSIRLVHTPADDKLPFAALRKRDHYVRMVVARCYLLGTRWKWSMHDAYVMFNKLVEIFKSRKFANLLSEESDFPAFLRYSNLQMLTELRKSDSAFGLFLKLVVLAGKCKDGGSEPAQRANARLKKLLSLTVPLSGVPFNKNSPPVGQELSMLYNRFSSVIVAIYLEPTVVNLRNRLAQARRYITFAEADWKSRQACIRALMYAAILVRHLDLPLDEPLGWLEEMVDSLLRDYDNAENALKVLGNKLAANAASDSRNKIVLTIQLLLGCVRKILETSSMDPYAVIVVQYPPLGLIDAPWIKKVFAKKDLTGTFTTRMEILKLLHSFLDARDKIIPRPRRPALAPLVDAETQESQDEYGAFDIDIDDPDLIAALDNGGEVQPADENKSKDAKIAEIMDSCILPIVLRLMMHQVHDSPSPSGNNRLEDHWLDLDKWVDCWVGCASIVVANGKRNWSYYLSLGSQSWKIMSDSSLRRRVGLRFMLGLLQRDPSSYKEQQESCHEVLIESLVAYKVTAEHGYVSLVFTLDGLRHPMLRGIPVHRENEQTDFNLSKSQFLERRLQIIECIIENLNTSLSRITTGLPQLQYLNNRWLGFIAAMLSSMKDILENLQGELDRIAYQTFYSKVLAIIKNSSKVYSHYRLAPLLAWSTTLNTSA